MKRPTLLFILLAVTLLPALAPAQEDDRAENVGERVGSAIERFVDQMTRRLSRSFEDDDILTDGDTIRTKRSRTRDIEDLESEENTKVYSSETTVAESVIVDGNIVVKGADLIIAGKVDGDVLVVGGDLVVKQHGVVAGNARVINGSIMKEEGAVIEGYEDRTGASTASYREPRRRFGSRGTSFDVPWLSEQSDFDDVMFRYNRVEGVFLGLGTDKKYNWDGQRRLNSYGSVGYGFKSHRWRGNLGLGWQFPLKNTEGRELLEFGIEGYSLTDTKDQWLIQPMENTLAALLIHEDYRDYFQREGFSIHGAYYTIQGDVKAEAKVAYLIDQYDSLSNRVDWAFFGGAKRFRLNPAIDPGKMRSITASIGFNTVSRTWAGPQGWNIMASAEVAKESFGSDFDFDHYVVDVRRFQPLGSYESLNLRLRVGTAGGAVPLQKAFDLGGLGTVPAYGHKDEMGNRLLLVNAEFIINGNFLDDLDLWPTWLFRNFNFLIQSDAGIVRAVSPNETPTSGFNDITWREFRHDLGIGFANRSGSFRIGLTWRTDRKEPARLLFRINRPF